MRHRKPLLDTRESVVGDGPELENGVGPFIHSLERVELVAVDVLRSVLSHTEAAPYERVRGARFFFGELDLRGREN